MELTVTHDDGTTQVVSVKPVDLIAFERHFGTSWYGSRTDPRLEHLFFLAWNATRRTGETREFDVWLEQVADLDEAATPKAKPPTKSRRSP